MVTPLGASAQSSCAAIRAGLMRFRELETSPLADNERVVVSAVDGLASDEARLPALVRGALVDVANQLRLVDGEKSAAIVSLPPQAAIDERQFTELVSRVFDSAAVFREVRFVPGDETALLAGLQQLGDEIDSGAIERVLLVAADSLVEPPQLIALQQSQRLKTKGCHHGMVPGEAGVALVLERSPNKPIAWLESEAVEAQEPVLPDQVADGSALSRALRRTLGERATAADNCSVELVVSDMNGELLRSEELGYATTRVLGPGFRLWHPADSVGCCGGAATALNVVVAACGLDRGYAATSEAVVTATGTAARASVLVRRCDQGEG